MLQLMLIGSGLGAKLIQWKQVFLRGGVGNACHEKVRFYTAIME